MASQYRPFTEENFLRRGLELRFKNENWKRMKVTRQTQEFIEEFGAHPKALAMIWRDLQTARLLELRIEDWVQPDHLLVVYRWMKGYEPTATIRRTMGFGEDGIRKWCKDVTLKIAGLRKIKIDPNWEDDDGVILGGTVDGVHYKIDEPRPFSTKFKSHKMGQAGLDYEIVIYTFKDKIAHLNGPFPAATNDKEVFAKGLLAAIEKKQDERMNNFRLIADDGYVNSRWMHVLSFRNELDPAEIAYYKDCALSRQERFNGLTKNYKILNSNFRHDRGWNPQQDFPRHKAVFEAICVTLQYEFDLGIKTLFDPYP